MKLKEIKFLKFRRFYTLNGIIMLPQIIKNKKIIIEDKVIADCLEALIGAIYLEKGLNFVEKFIKNLLK